MMSIDRAELRTALDAVGADAWLLFDFHGLNPVARRVARPGGGWGRDGSSSSCRRRETPIAVGATRSSSPRLEGFPGKVVPYARWQELQEALAPLVQGEAARDGGLPQGRGALPSTGYRTGVVQMLEGLGGTIVPSGEMVTRFASRWSDHGGGRSYASAADGAGEGGEGGAGEGGARRGDRAHR